MKLSFYLVVGKDEMEIEVVNSYNHLQPILVTLDTKSIHYNIDSYLKSRSYYLDPDYHQLLDFSYWYKDLPIEKYHKKSNIYHLADHDLSTVSSYIYSLHYYSQQSTIKSIYPELFI